MNKEILCSISTKGRYDTTLPMAISSVITQTKRPDYIIIQDDNDEPKDVREIQHYNYLMQMLSECGIAWEWLYTEKKGQHHNHQRANTKGFKWVWRLDDDTIAESNVLETLYRHATLEENVGAVGGSVLTPPSMGEVNATGKIEHIYNEPNLQWGRIKEKKEVDPEVFLKGAEGLGLSPELCIVFEDAQAGVEAAKAGNMKAIGIGDAETLNQADKIIPNFIGVNAVELLQF